MVRVTISGKEQEARELLQFLVEVLKSFDAHTSNIRGPYPNQREIGKRFYLNVSMPRNR
jgi:hypothetical protein